MRPAAKSADTLSRSLPKRTSASLVQSVATRGRSRAEVVLEPAELGRVRFDIATHGDTVQVTLLVERPETLDLLRRHVEELRQEFRAAGFDTGSLSFGQWGQRGEGRASPDLAGSEVFADEAMELAPVTAPPQPPRPSLGAGLDLRL